jgi:O-antigen ligase
MTPLPSPPAMVLLRREVIGEWTLILGLMGTLVWTTLCLGGYLPQTMVVTSTMIFGLTVLGCLLWLRGNNAFNPAALLPVPFLLWALASVAWIAPARWLAWREWLLWLQMWLVFVLVLHFGRGRKLTGLILIGLIGLGLTGVGLAAYQRFVNPAWIMLGRTQAEQFFHRSAGMFGVPNSLAGLLELMIPVGLTTLFSRRVRPEARIVSGWLALLFIFGLGLTGSRGGWLALSLALLLWPLLGAGQWWRRIVGAGVVLLVLVGAIAALLQFSENARARLTPLMDGQVEASRPVFWKIGYEIWRDHPVVGGGAGSYSVLFEHYQPRGFPTQPLWAHNDYINTLSDYGVIGFALWAGAGSWLGWSGWRAVRRARETGANNPDFFSSATWRLGLLLGLLAFAFHLAVDFHTKIPALALAAAVGAGLLLRIDPGSRSTTASRRWLMTVPAAGAVGLVIWVARPLYRAESFRYDSRRWIDRQAASGATDLRAGLPQAKANFERAVAVDSSNGQAWADLSYAIMLGWRDGSPGELNALGEKAEAAARRAVALCPVDAEFQIRLGVALDAQTKLAAGEPFFRRAIELAPNSPVAWYHYAYHLQWLRDRRAEALVAVETCLSLDPSNSAAVLLRQQLAVGR